MGIDFKKRLTKKSVSREVDPLKIFENLDRKADKGPLRVPVQDTILTKWHNERRQDRDLIVKLPTGEGKTLVGLLMLQSHLNEGIGPALYLCPNNYLAEQVHSQAEQFGIPVCTIGEDLPDDFSSGKKILVASAQSLFNGRNQKFGLDGASLEVGSVLLDDAHTCIEVIRDSAKIECSNEQHAYQELFQLFSEELKSQGAGTYEDIRNKDYDALLPVPYWDWISKETDVASILSKHATQKVKDIWFSWPLIKDDLKDCMCTFSGTSVEIVPYKIPIHRFGSFFKAARRIFMSATLNDDAFFIKDLGLNRKVIENPLTIKGRGWSGEKMILLPSIIHAGLDRTTIINRFGKAASRKFGVVALTPSFKISGEWKNAGAVVPSTTNIYSEISKLKGDKKEYTLAIANRYDGIDLPDDACRVLIIDSKPLFESLTDRLLSASRPKSKITKIKTAQKIEQGLGRAVRGEKDYCVVLLVGKDLIKEIRSKESKRFFSQQTQKQIELGLEISSFAVEDSQVTDDPMLILTSVIRQSLERDQGWKDFYVENMQHVPEDVRVHGILDILEQEGEAEKLYSNGKKVEAASLLQKLVDSGNLDDEDKGWYLQTMARYLYRHSKDESVRLQIAAHNKNRMLLKPKDGIQVSKISITQQKRLENIKNFLKAHENYENLHWHLDEALSNLRFGVNPEQFEEALDIIGKFLGFECERPDKTWKSGPDNLWALADNSFLLIECKNKVLESRESINKDETGQMNNACAWFKREYNSTNCQRVLIIPTKKIMKESGAGFNENVSILRQNGLSKFVNDIRQFMFEFKKLDFQSISESKIKELIETHALVVENILSIYTEEPRIL